MKENELIKVLTPHSELSHRVDVLERKIEQEKARNETQQEMINALINTNEKHVLIGEKLARIQGVSSLISGFGVLLASAWYLLRNDFDFDTFFELLSKLI